MPPSTTPKKHRNSRSSPPANAAQLIPEAHQQSKLHDKKAQFRRPFILCCAAVCFLFAALLIVAGIVTLIVFLVIKPRYPRFDVSGATLNAIYFDSPAFLNGDFTFLANFSNPNEKISVRFQYVALELFFSDTLISTQALKPFSQGRKEVKLAFVHMVTSEVFLSNELSGALRDQVSTNKVMYAIKGTFKVRASLGFIHVTYWLYGQCTLELSQPPSGVLLAKSCRTKR